MDTNEDHADLLGLEENFSHASAYLPPTSTLSTHRLQLSHWDPVKKTPSRHNLRVLPRHQLEGTTIFYIEECPAEVMVSGELTCFTRDLLRAYLLIRLHTVPRGISKIRYIR